MGGAHRPWDYRDSRRLDPVVGVQSQTFDPLSDSSAGEHPVDNREVVRSTRTPTTNFHLALAQWISGRRITNAEVGGSIPSCEAMGH